MEKTKLSKKSMTSPPHSVPITATSFVTFRSKLSQRIRKNFWRSKNTQVGEGNPQELPMGKSICLEP